MQYETIFDVHNAYPQRWTGMWFGVALVILFLMARFRKAQLEAPGLRQAVLAWVPRQIWPSLVRPYLEFLLEALVMSVFELAIIMAPRWRWGIVAGLAIIGLDLWQYYADAQKIAALQNPGTAEMVAGPVTKIGSYVTSHQIRRGYIEVDGHYFNYASDDAGSPYRPTNMFIFQGQNVRLTYVGDRIIRVERQLCLQYKHCTVSYFLGMRFEQDAG